MYVASKPKTGRPKTKAECGRMGAMAKHYGMKESQVELAKTAKVVSYYFDKGKVVCARHEVETLYAGSTRVGAEKVNGFLCPVGLYTHWVPDRLFPVAS